MKKAVFAIAFATSLASGSAFAVEPTAPQKARELPASTPIAERTVTSAHLRIADVMPEAPASALDVELGPSPSPGASRIVTKDEIVRSLRRANVGASFAMPASVRVTREADHLSRRAFEDLARAAITSSLPEGVSLTRVDAAVTVTVPAGTRVRRAKLPKLPKTKGPFHTSVNVELAQGDERVAEIPIAVVVEISEAAAAPDLKKGAHVTVVVEKETLRISTDGVLTKDCDVGDVTTVTVVATGRALHVKITAKDRAELWETH